MSAERTLHFSTDFAISCGTITIDPPARKVLLLRGQSSGEYLLPKGRKNPGESLESAALRETYEESGVKCELLPHAFPHLAPFAPGEETSGENGSKPLSTEPIAVQQRMSMGAWKLIFWFIAQADSKLARVEGTQESYEDFDTIWADIKEAPGLMSRPGDDEILRKAFGAVFGAGGGMSL
jgi:8-oxo-dGTP pyrophosphatase MutT (NUDIX family)